ncbi:DNA-binding response regulator [Halomicronema hongdechloris C2206]|uniref:DNA-binding response regulator n=1 Tax=Halomicronema hongdechloris C2206 TaxID=1641165 RepID=A0A1Z3HQA7_9CYAN|nr:response regulator [Halomicronema hongdechloris]ASC72491.1 DNA-binding response regulator [Halomicronema hongdechloris C2206]
MTRKILVIEDEAQTRELFLNCLKFEDFQGFGAENGCQGIDLAKTERPDLIVCDIMMPDMDGYEVLSTLHQTPATASIPFIFLTAKVTMADLRRGMTLGADDYLTKPCTVNQFLSAIATRLKRKEALNQGFCPAEATPIASDSPVSGPTPEPIFPDYPKLNPIFQFIDAHYQKSLNLSDVAKVVGYSPAYLTNLVHTQTGRTVKQWIIERRMAQARALLAHTNQSIRQIAEAAGYSDPGYFARQFRQCHGVSPQVWRGESVT